jgi:hypothetical protein
MVWFVINDDYVSFADKEEYFLRITAGSKGVIYDRKK